MPGEGLTKLSPAALKAAMQGGTEAWGQWGSVLEHIRYAEPITGRRGRRKCSCGCGKRATHKGFANGICLMSGCELAVRRWVRNPVDTYRRRALASQEKP
jgi:hypothetical protein